MPQYRNGVLTMMHGEQKGRTMGTPLPYRNGGGLFGGSPLPVNRTGIFKSNWALTPEDMIDDTIGAAHYSNADRYQQASGYPTRGMIPKRLAGRQFPQVPGTVQGPRKDLGMLSGLAGLLGLGKDPLPWCNDPSRDPNRPCQPPVMSPSSKTSPSAAPMSSRKKTTSRTAPVKMYPSCDDPNRDPRVPCVETMVGSSTTSGKAYPSCDDPTRDPRVPCVESGMGTISGLGVGAGLIFGGLALLALFALPSGWLGGKK